MSLKPPKKHTFLFCLLLVSAHPVTMHVASEWLVTFVEYYPIHYFYNKPSDIWNLCPLQKENIS